MQLSEWASIAAIANFILFAVIELIDRWPQILKRGKPILPKIALIFLVMGIISAGVSLYASWHEPKIGKEIKLSTEEESTLKQLIQDYRNIPKESSKKLSALRSLGEETVLKLPLEERPKLEFTDKEIKTLIKTSRIITGKILRNQVDWDGYADLAEAKLKAHEDHQRKIFGVQEVK